MITVVTDTTSYFTKQEAESLNIVVMPMNYSIASMQFKESFCDQNGNFEDFVLNNKEMCKTAQVSFGEYYKTFKSLTDKGHDVLCIVISSKLSGAFNSASVAAREINSKKIIVIDSLSVAGGLYFLVKKAVELIKENMPFDKIAVKIEELREKTGIAFSVDEMSYLRMSGRLGFVPQFIGTTLDNRPILLFKDGAVVSKGVAKGGRARISMLAQSVPENAKQVLIHYINDERYVEHLETEVKTMLPGITVSKNKLGPVLAIHLGSGVIGISWICD